ncbi:tRNA (guanosine(46)-N7)-methyltransferase TrmB [Mycoplasmopsis primatum]|uniref:tRNA (guanosine(46)-N7)-methyltransferase TrmB n=1 Tax=Mycoplasmopsis primatum TaxID=55604 RepID=UPI000495294A|nr:tRNA (guanosine(46)-N7)-methyltransferase TrmB [Mycoplasmopsis primatum]
MRLRYDNNAIDKLNASNYLIKYNDQKIKLNTKTVVEIGMGKGEMLVEMANYCRDKQFIGLEKYATVAAKCIKKADEYKLTNFSILLADASKIDEIFTGQCDEIWLTFSDPWPKARHEKRRLTHSLFLNKYKLILSNDGILKIKTDNDDFYNYSLESLQNNNWEIIVCGNDLHSSKFNAYNFQTGYEKKWSSKGKNINFIFARKTNNN